MEMVKKRIQGRSIRNGRQNRDDGRRQREMKKEEKKQSREENEEEKGERTTVGWLRGVREK